MSKESAKNAEGVNVGLSALALKFSSQQLQTCSQVWFYSVVFMNVI